MRPTARLDNKTGLRVLCGAKDDDGRYTCRGELARVAVLKADRRVLCMLDGWKHKARGHWVLNAHSARRLAGAESAVSRGLLSAEQLAERSRPRFRRPIPVGSDANAAGYGLSADNYVVFPGTAGILADCPRCTRTNVLTETALRVAPN